MNQDDDADHLVSLYRQLGPSIYRRALKLLQNVDDAVEVAQDTFLAFMKMKSTINEHVSAFTVLYQICTYNSVNRLRQRSRWSGVLDSLTVYEDEQDERQVANTGSNAGGIGRVEALQDLVVLTHGELPQVLTAAVLYFVEGYTIEETAEVLELSRKTTSKLLRQFAKRARKRSTQLGVRAAP